MWWLFELLEKIGSLYRYAYSCEDRSLDGIVEYDENTKEVVLTKPCSYDADSKWAQNRSTGKFISYVVEENLPNRRMIACG